jgi:hypothetical protein
MPLTLADAAKLSRNALVKGIIETIITESDVLKYLPFMGLTGASLKLATESTTLGGASWYTVGDTWTEGTSDIATVTESLYALGGDADVDNFLNQTYNDTNNLRAEIVAKKVKQMAYSFNDNFFNGDNSVNSKQWSGLKKRCGTVNTGAPGALGYTATVRAASNGANGNTPTLAVIDEFVDAIKPGRPDVLFMSKRSRRTLSALKRASGSGVLETGADSFGRRVVMYDGIPIAVDENLVDTETQGTSVDCSSIYAVKFGFEVGVMGLYNGPDASLGLAAEPIGRLETKDAWRTRVKWYCGLVNFRNYSIARLAGNRP